MSKYSKYYCKIPDNLLYSHTTKANELKIFRYAYSQYLEDISEIPDAYDIKRIFQGELTDDYIRHKKAISDSDLECLFTTHRIKTWHSHGNCNYNNALIILSLFPSAITNVYRSVFKVSLEGKSKFKIKEFFSSWDRYHNSWNTLTFEQFCTNVVFYE